MTVTVNEKGYNGETLSSSITLIVVTPTGETGFGVIVNYSPLTASPAIEKYDGIAFPEPSIVLIETALK